MIAEKALRAFSEYLDKDKIGVAVSGGGDSVALLRLLSDFAKDRDVEVFVYTVDHGLRPEAADEASFVADLAQALGCKHRVLTWRWGQQGNLSAAAREGRYDAIAKAAIGDGVSTVLLGHTQDDQAETVLMALTRSAGVDGLSGMQSAKVDRGICWLRPLLGTTRAELRAYLTEIGQSWIDDPSNDNDAYERVKMRKAAETLEGLGITSSSLGDVAQNMQAARQALELATTETIKRTCYTLGGAVRIDRSGFLANTPEIQRRVLARFLSHVAPSAGSLRRSAMQNALVQTREGSDSSVGGCLILLKSDHIWVVREPIAVAGLETDTDAIWDGKWKMTGGTPHQGAVIRALGEAGLRTCENWRDAGLPRPALLSSPSIWQNDRLIAAPLAGYGGEWSAELLLGAEDFLS